MNPDDKRPPTPDGTPPGDDRDPGVSARVPQPLFDQIEALRRSWSDGLEGKPAPRSAVLRALLIEGQVLMDPPLRAVVARHAAARGVPMDAAWREVVEAGIGQIKGDLP